MIWFTSDTHFGHENIISHCNRPFATTEEMDATMIKNWNDRVSHSDTVHVVGDFSFRASKHIQQYVDELNGRIVLILGNHDEKNKEILNVFGVCPKLLKIKYYKQRIILCHYQMANWQGKNRDIMPSWHLFGHAHGLTNPDVIQPGSMDVGVDVHEFKPLSFEDIKKCLSQQEK